MPGRADIMIGDDRGDGADERHGQEIVALAEAEDDAEEIGRQQDIEADRLGIADEAAEHAAEQR